MCPPTSRNRPSRNPPTAEPGHNYIGTEHILLGVLFAGGDAADALVGLGLDPATAEAHLREELARLQS